MKIYFKKYWSLILVFVLFALCLWVHLISANDQWVESVYFQSYYPLISKCQRQIFGSITWSVGDIIYALIVLFMIGYIIHFWVKRKQPKTNQAVSVKIVKLIKAFFMVTAVFYLLFNLLWGINYNRKGIAYQLNLDQKKYSVFELNRLNSQLAQQVNEFKSAQVKSEYQSFEKDAVLFDSTKKAYQKASLTFPFLQYQYPSIKSSSFSLLLNFLGINGYYNPFTGEAQVNTSVPVFIRPFVACHEVAHQLGYASESEASFVGYLVAKSSDNNSLLYSAYMDLFLSANRNLYQYDSVSAKHWRDVLDPEVKSDFKTWRSFLKSYQNPVEPFITRCYDLFLKSNHQPQGILSYDEVVLYMIQYQRKFGEL